MAEIKVTVRVYNTVKLNAIGKFEDNIKVEGMVNA